MQNSKMFLIFYVIYWAISQLVVPDMMLFSIEIVIDLKEEFEVK
jgi:hypothetical protein